MHKTTLTQELASVMAHQQQDEARVLAQAMRTGIRALYRETLEEIEYQCDALKRDVVWGMCDA